MSADIIVGLQFGSEGKGKISALLAQRFKYSAAVRVGAPNAGHTIIHEDKTFKMQTIPCAWVDPNVNLCIGAGGLINMHVLERELRMLERYNIPPRLFIDVNAGIVTADDIEAEKQAKMYEGIGSTCEGIGEAMSRKLLRRTSLTAKSMSELQPFLINVGEYLNRMLDLKKKILIEGTQGYGLSLNHGYYPFVTSRDVLASSILGECGIAPSRAGSVIGVMRTYPIRVHGNSGPMGAAELTWEEVARRSGYDRIEERTTVTNRIRRVSEINWDMLRAAVAANRPDYIALMFIDYINAQDRAKSLYDDLSIESKRFIHTVEQELNVPVNIISTGPKPEHTIFK